MEEIIKNHHAANKNDVNKIKSDLDDTGIQIQFYKYANVSDSMIEKIKTFSKNNISYIIGIQKDSYPKFENGDIWNCQRTLFIKRESDVHYVKFSVNIRLNNYDDESIQNKLISSFEDEYPIQKKGNKELSIDN